MVELAVRERGFDRRLAVAGESLAQDPLADLAERLLHEVADEAGVRAVLEHGGRAAVSAPAVDHPAQRLVAHVEGALERVGGGEVLVRIPQFDRGVQVAHAVAVAPIEDRRGVNVPCEVEQKVARRHARGQERVEVLGSDPVDLVLHALGDEVGDSRTVVHEVDHGDRAGVDSDVVDEEGERALGNAAAAEHQHAAGNMKCVHDNSFYGE